MVLVEMWGLPWPLSGLRGGTGRRRPSSQQVVLPGAPRARSCSSATAPPAPALVPRGARESAPVHLGRGGCERPSREQQRHCRSDDSSPLHHSYHWQPRAAARAPAIRASGRATRCCCGRAPPEHNARPGHALDTKGAVVRRAQRWKRLRVGAGRARAQKSEGAPNSWLQWPQPQGKIRWYRRLGRQAGGGREAPLHQNLVRAHGASGGGTPLPAAGACALTQMLRRARGDEEGD